MLTLSEFIKVFATFFKLKKKKTLSLNMFGFDTFTFSILDFKSSGTLHLSSLFRFYMAAKSQLLFRKECPPTKNLWFISENIPKQK